MHHTTQHRSDQMQRMHRCFFLSFFSLPDNHYTERIEPPRRYDAVPLHRVNKMKRTRLTGGCFRAATLTLLLPSKPLERPHTNVLCFPPLSYRFAYAPTRYVCVRVCTSGGVWLCKCRRRSVALRNSAM